MTFRKQGNSARQRGVENVALVTGGGRRGGRAIALALGRAGVSVAVHYRTSRFGAMQVVKTLKRLGVRGQAFRADLAKSSEVRRLVGQVERSFGPVGILVNNASHFLRTPFPRTTAFDWDQIFATNLRAPFFLAKEIGLRMKRRGGGSIINVADWAGLSPYRHYLPYSLSQSGLIAMTRGLARLLGPEVRVYAIAPRRLRSFKPLAMTVLHLATNGGPRSGATYDVDGKLLTR